MSTTFDTFAWIEYLSGSQRGRKVKEIIDSDEQIYTPSICLAELKAKYIREGKEHAKSIDFIRRRSVVTNIDAETALFAAELKISENLAMVDALVYSVAKGLKTKLVTGDKHFAGKQDVVFV